MMMREIKEMNVGGLKIPYVTPLTEVVEVQSEGIMNPESWSDGQGGYFPINEEDPEGDGRGAKGNSLWDGGRNKNLWDE